MKNILLDIAAVVIGLAIGVAIAMLPAHATNFPAAQIVDTQTETLVAPTMLQTNLAGSTFFIERNTYHAIQVVNSGTNTAFVAIDRSLDGSSWMVGWTQIVAAASSNDTNVVGKWSYLRTRCYSTNTPLTVLYLGGK